MRATWLAVALVVLPLAAMPPASAGCSPVVGTVYVPETSASVSPALYLCDTNHDGTADTVLVGEGAGPAGVGAMGMARITGPFLDLAIAPGVGVGTPLGGVGIDGAWSCHTVIGDAGCDTSGSAFEAYAPGFGAGGATSQGIGGSSANAGGGILSVGGGAAARQGPGGIVVCAYQPVGFRCVPVAA